MVLAHFVQTFDQKLASCVWLGYHHLRLLVHDCAPSRHNHCWLSGQNASVQLLLVVCDQAIKVRRLVDIGALRSFKFQVCGQHFMVRRSFSVDVLL